MACAFREFCGQLHCVNGTNRGRREERISGCGGVTYRGEWRGMGCFETVMRTGCACVVVMRGREGSQRVREGRAIQTAAARK